MKTLQAPELNQDSSEESFAALVERVRHSPELRPLLDPYLPQQAAMYRGRGTNATVRMRGWLFAAYEQVGLPDSALPWVLQELESGEQAYLVAGAAMALRGMPNPTPEIAPFLLRALTNMLYMDDAVTFEEYKPKWPRPTYTTALGEIVRTLRWMGPLAHTLLPQLEHLLGSEVALPPVVRRELGEALEALRTESGAGAVDASAAPARAPSFFPIEFVESLPPPPLRLLDVSGIEFEDQDARLLTWDEFFSGAPAVVVFFYTRCSNPRKCSLTVEKLARLQRRLCEQPDSTRVKTAAITYDPAYDAPYRLKVYGSTRGVTFDEDNRFLRARSRFDDLQQYFDLGVNFGAATVNHHRIELFIVDAAGRIADAATHLQWDVEAVVEKALQVAKSAAPTQSSV